MSNTFFGNTIRSLGQHGGLRDRKNSVDRSGSTVKSKTVKGFWVRRGDRKVDRDRWVTISKIAVPSKVGPAVAAEVTGVCVLAEILDLVCNRCLRIQNQSVH